jgi:hypothetical protein
MLGRAAHGCVRAVRAQALLLGVRPAAPGQSMPRLPLCSGLYGEDIRVANFGSSARAVLMLSLTCA